MQFTCSTEKLIEAVQIVTKGLGGNTINPILEGILIETEGNQLVFTCTDERITIVTRIPADIQEAGRGVVPGKMFSEHVRRLTDDDNVDIRMDERYVFTIRCGRSRKNISGQDADLFPTLPRIEDEREISLPQDMLRDMIQKTEFAISQKHMHEVLTGCLLEISGGDVTMVALDGVRLAMRSAKCSDVLEKVSAVIPGRAVGDIGKLLSSEEDAFAQLSFGGNKMHIRLDDTEIFVILVVGDYVNYRDIIPKSSTTHVEVELEPFRRYIDRVALSARESSNNLIMLRIEGDTMVIEANSQQSEAHEEMEIVKQGPDLNIAFNVKYLIDVVRFMDSERISLQMNSPTAPCVVTPVGDSDYLHQIMPVRTGAR